MASWSEFEAAAPELAAGVRERKALVIDVWTPEEGVRSFKRT